MTLPDFSFESVDADDYQRLRPDYSPAAVAWLVAVSGLGDERCVLDLGAGPGSLARRFVDVGVPVIGVEPAANMRAKLEQVVGPGRALDGTAEAIPLPTDAVDCVVAAQAVHWFRPREAAIEIHRVLKPEGTFAWLWTIYDNGEDERSGEPRRDEQGHAPAALVEIVNRHEPPGWQDQFTGRPWKEGFETFSSTFFSSPEVHTFPAPHKLPAADVVAWVATWSDVAALPSTSRDELLAEVRMYSETLPDVVTFPASTELHLARRRDAGGVVNPHHRGPGF